MHGIGSGKTYTMMGSKTDPGLVPRLCTALFSKIDANANHKITYKVEVSYMEIYNEKVFLIWCSLFLLIPRSDSNTDARILVIN